jgi:polysaccharide export outer membrane protein
MIALEHRFEFLVLLSLCSPAFVVGQTTTPAPPVAAGQAGASVPASATGAGSSDQDAYRLRAGDVVAVRFFFNEELNTKVQIRPDGYISLPLISQVLTNGLTVNELRSALANSYKGILRNPDITIQVEGYSERKIFVGGEVAKPGVMPLTGRETLLSAIFESGGLTRGANRRAATVFRRTETGGVERISVSLREVFQKNSNGPVVSFLLQPLDVVVVHESGIAKADRAVDQYVRQLIPLQLTGGFEYLFNGFAP